MNDRGKRLLLFLGLIVLTIGIAYAIYAVFFKGGEKNITERPTVEDTGTEGTEGLPGSTSGTATGGTGTTGSTDLPVSAIADGGFTETTRLTSSEVISPTLSEDGKSISYYDPSTGKFYSVDRDGETKALSDKTFPKAETIVWSDDANEVVVEFPDGSNVIFDFITEDQTTLPSHWEEFDFAPSGEQVIAKSIGNDPQSRAIVITNTDTSNTKVVAALGDNADKVDISWSPNDQVIAFSNTADTSASAGGGLGRNMILPIGKNEENYKGLVVEGLNFHGTWSPDGSQILYDVTSPSSGYRPTLWVVDGTSSTMGNNRRSLGINTWVDKCTFTSNTELYCAVPTLLEENAGLQPDLVDAADGIYHIDLSTGKVKFLGYPEVPTEMSSLTISENGADLYYTDLEGRLQLMRLK